MARIRTCWFIHVFRDLRDHETANRTLGGPLSYAEGSHLVAMLEKAGLISVAGTDPITIVPTDLFYRHDDNALLGMLRDKLVLGVEIVTPVRRARNVIIEWAMNREGEEIVRYRSLHSQAPTQAETDAMNETDEVERRMLQAIIFRRPRQGEFSEKIRTNYGCACAVTGCTTLPALEAAHVRTVDGRDSNASDNGILLRADIHALLDAFLITFNSSGTRLEASHMLDDRTYHDLHNARVAAPVAGQPLSASNIRHHRRLFREAEAIRKQARQADTD